MTSTAAVIVVPFNICRYAPALAYQTTVASSTSGEKKSTVLTVVLIALLAIIALVLMSMFVLKARAKSDTHVAARMAAAFSATSSGGGKNGKYTIVHGPVGDFQRGDDDDDSLYVDDALCCCRFLLLPFEPYVPLYSLCDSNFVLLH